MKIENFIYVYILECSDTTYYTGCTNDLEKRIKEHNTSKKGAKYTKMRRPVVLKYTEIFATLGEARSREAEIKKLPRNKKIKLVHRSL
ncbi:MAG: GIY-YIG nuclease family protein [Candidatus Levybacteria bacterium]|nr:GIY-YIG nuclease family protein [Candidatus Levybacteria bacterium]